MDNKKITGAKVTAEMTQDTFKHVFSALIGRPDSKVKMFFDHVIIKPDDVIELNKKLLNKLNIHEVIDVVTSVDIIYKNNEIEQYGIWDDFTSKNWKTSKETKSINIKWDFLIKMPRQDLPQHHGISVKIASQFTPLHMMRAMLSEDPSDLDKIETEVAPIICRIDFVNSILADELLFIVEEWVKSIINPSFTPSMAKILDKHKNKIGAIIKYGLPLTFSFVLAGFLNINLGYSLLPNDEVTVNILKLFMYWLLFSVIILFALMKLGESLARSTMNLIKKYGHHFPINFTNGDQNRINKIEGENKNSLVRISINMVVTLLLNIISAFISYYFFN